VREHRLPPRLNHVNFKKKGQMKSEKKRELASTNKIDALNAKNTVVALQVGTLDRRE